MSAVASPVSVEQFLDPDDDNVRLELIGGEIITMSRGGQPSPHDAPMPDVSVVLAGRLRPGHTGLIALCPDLVVASENQAVLASWRSRRVGGLSGAADCSGLRP